MLRKLSLLCGGLPPSERKFLMATTGKFREIKIMTLAQFSKFWFAFIFYKKNKFRKKTGPLFKKKADG
jgi:hypothetical protein